MKLKHYTDVDEQITQIDLDNGEALYVQHSVFDKKTTYKVGKDDNDSVTVKVEDNLFLVIAKKGNKVDQRVFSDLFGFHIEKAQ